MRKPITTIFIALCSSFFARDTIYPSAENNVTAAVNKPHSEIVTNSNTLDVQIVETVTNCDYLGISKEDSIRIYILNHPTLQYKEIVLAQITLETGHMTSYAYRENSNLFGIIDNLRTREACEFRSRKFAHWKESVDFYINNIQSRLKDGEDYYQFIDRIGYAEDADYIKKLKRIK